MKNKLKITQRSLSGLIILAIVATACNLPRSADESTPTLGVTQAYQTIEARLTQEAGATATPSPTSQATTAEPPATTATATNTSTSSPTSTGGSSGGTSGCDVAAPGNPIDVTIPDDTEMSPGQAFTKTWRLVNAGTCTWTTSYSVTFFSGDAMSAPASVPLPSEVAPNETIEISVDMVAPSTPGTYQGNWKLRNDQNQWFGLGPGGGSPFWVRIIVVEGASGSSTPGTPGTPGTPTVTFTAAPTSEVLVSGTRSLLPSDRLNLDNGKQNGGSGEDLLFSMNIKSQLQLAPRNGAQIGYFGTTPPTEDNCKATSVDIAPLLLDSLSGGSYLCYQTDNGLWGWLLLKAFDNNTLTLTVEFLTWTAP